MDIQQIIDEGQRLLGCFIPEFRPNNTLMEKIAEDERQNLLTWIHSALAYMETYYPESSDVVFFKNAAYSSQIYTDVESFERLVSILRGFSALNKKTSKDYTILDTIFFHFPSFIRQLKKRHDNRQSIEVNDEYDVQDLLEAVLRLHFDDVRAEEWCPSYAGGSKRMDFFLNDEKIAIETKMTRKGLADKQIGEQLTIDIVNYKKHPNCETLYCFVYDPDGLIRNPKGLSKDLESIDNEINIKVIIKPD